MNTLEKWSGVLWILGGAAIMAFGMSHAYKTGHKSASNHYKALMAEADKVHAEVYARLEAECREHEQNHAKELARIDKENTERLKYVQAKNRADLAALRNGALQLHERFICPDTDTAMSEAGTTDSLGNGAGRGGLRIADAEFLVSLTDRADEIVIQLQACQDIVRADRNVASP